MRSPATPPGRDFVPYATATLDVHRALNLPHVGLATTRAELDTLHAHVTSLLYLLDAHAVRTRRLVRTEGDCLAAARTRLWQTADHLHSAFHTAPRSRTGDEPAREACRAGLPDGAPRLTICRRHQAAAVLVRCRCTPADLHDPFTGLVRH